MKLKEAAEQGEAEAVEQADQESAERYREAAARIEQVFAAEQPPQFRNANEELAWRRNQDARRRAMIATEAHIDASLRNLSAAVGRAVRRDDPRIDLRTPEAFNA